jgi:hypothetical protein
LYQNKSNARIRPRQAYTEKSILKSMSLQRAEGLDIRLANSFRLQIEQDVAALEAMIFA